MDHQVQNKIKTIIFCGGRGGKNIINALIKNSLFDVSIVVNAYDDGLSTGYLRKLIPGFLGPSDIRKNFSYLVDTSYPDMEIIKEILEYRFPPEYSDKDNFGDLKAVAESGDIKNNDLDSFISRLSYKISVKIREYAKIFLEYIERNKIKFKFNDCSLGNILLAGCFIKNNRNFNSTIKEFSSFLKIKGKIYNVSLGENYVLSALRKDGVFLPSEASIVEKRSNIEVDEIFLLENYLSKSELRRLNQLRGKSKRNSLKNVEKFPELNYDVKKLIEHSDLIIFSPGTQHSSLFPTYLTQGLIEAIKSNQRCKKIFISNILEDNDIPGVSVNELINKATFYLNRKNMLNFSPKDIFDFALVNLPKEKGHKYISLNKKFILPNVILEDFEDGKSGKHDGQKVLEVILRVFNISFNNKTVKKLSIIIPAYNESRFLRELIERIKCLDLLDLGVVKEIILIDNGSTDNTQEVIKDIKGIRKLKIEKNNGKGEAVILGIKEASGDLLVIQDADLEYDPKDIKEMVRIMISHGFKAVYGSRTIRKNSRAKALNILYGKKKGAYWSFYLGGQLLSLVTYILFGEYLTDTVTGYKMYDSKMIKSLNLKSKGFELDHELTAKVLKKNVEIYEIPISYTPRTVEQGKKIKWKDGLIAIKTLFKFRFFD